MPRTEDIGRNARYYYPRTRLKKDRTDIAVRPGGGSFLTQLWPVTGH
jgi:hypothetical protein